MAQLGLKSSITQKQNRWISKRTRLVVVLVATLAILIGFGVGLWIRLTNTRFFLDETAYGNSDIVEIDANEYETLIREQASFALFIYQPLCTTSSEFGQIINDFTEQEQLQFYQMSFSEMQNTSLNEIIKYYPSFVIVQKGDVVDYLDANDDEDINIYQNLVDFEAWFTKYVILKDTERGDDSDTGTADTSKNETEDLKLDSLIENISYNDKKINIYFFWGNGCPHCAAEFEFFESIQSEYGDYFTLNTFETWHDEKNKKIAKVFAAAMGDELTGVPYTVIGDKSFVGFTESYESEILDAITSQYQNSSDIYFDQLIKDLI